MKTNKFLSFIIVIASAMLLASCGVNKNTSKGRPDDAWVDVDMPCKEKSIDDEGYFRAIGIGTSVNMQSAHLAAVENAQAEINRKVRRSIEGLSADYSDNMGGQIENDRVQRNIEAAFNSQVKASVGHAEKICEAMKQNRDNGTYRSFYTLQISKKELASGIADAMTNSLSEKEQYEIRYKREQFQKYVEDYLAKQKGNN